jgi:glycosyltransferase involved in cell wall biosynthesis
MSPVADTDRLRITSLTDFYDPVIGGLERHVKGLAAEFVRRGHEMTIISLAPPGEARSETIDGVLVERVTGLSQRMLRRLYASQSRPFHPTVPDPLVMRELSRVIGERKPDVVLAHSWILHSYLPIKHRHDAVLVAYLHDYGLVCARKTFHFEGREVCSGPAYAKCVRCSRGQYGALRGAALTTGLFADSRMYGRIDRLIANSHAVAEAVRTGPRVGCDEVAVIPPFLTPTSIDAGVARPGFLPADGDYLLFVGALGEHKGVSVLVDAWQGLDPRPPLVLLGTPQVDTPEHFPEGVTVVENVPHDAVMAAYSHATVTVVPSVWPEPFGKVAVEAMSLGCPVVATAGGGLAEIVRDGVDGLLVTPGDTLELRTAIARLLGDPGLRARLGERGRERAQHFTVESAVDQHERIYRAALAERR